MKIGNLKDFLTISAPANLCELKERVEKLEKKVEELLKEIEEIKRILNGLKK